MKPIPEMTKAMVEQGVLDVTQYHFDLTHKGEHRWESDWGRVNRADAGVFAAFLPEVMITVNAAPCGEPGTPNQDGLLSFFRITLSWKYTSGGSNGADLDMFYFHPTGKVITRALAAEIATRKR